MWRVQDQHRSDVVGGGGRPRPARGQVGSVVGGTVVSTGDEYRQGLATGGIGLAEGSIENPLHRGTEDSSPGGHVPLDEGAVPSVHGDLAPAALDGPREKLHCEGSGMGFRDVGAGYLGEREAAHLQDRAAAF